MYVYVCIDVIHVSMYVSSCMHICIYASIRVGGIGPKAGGGQIRPKARGGQIRPKAKEGGGQIRPKAGGGPVRHQARRQDLVGGAYSGEDRVFLA